MPKHLLQATGVLLDKLGKLQVNELTYSKPELSKVILCRLAGCILSVWDVRAYDNEDEGDYLSKNIYFCDDGGSAD